MSSISINMIQKRIKQINNATCTDTSDSTTKTIWAIYDMSKVHMKIIEIEEENYVIEF